MDAKLNMVCERTLHPLAINRESLQVLARWLKSNGARRVAYSDSRRTMIERYPVGLFTEAEIQALWDVMQG